MKIIETEYEPGDEVYVRHDPDQRMRMVTSFVVRGRGYAISYEVSCGDSIKWFYDFELSKEKNTVIATTG